MMTARRLSLLSLALAGVYATTACTNKPETVLPTGPSELGLSLFITATPELITADGMSTAHVTVTARGPQSEPRAGVPLRADITFNDAIVDYGKLSVKSATTGTDGRATFTYTAPITPVSGNLDALDSVDVLVTPLTGDFTNAMARKVRIRLVPQGSPGIPGRPRADFFWLPNRPFVDENVSLDGRLSRECPLDEATRAFILQDNADAEATKPPRERIMPPSCVPNPGFTYEWDLHYRGLRLHGPVIVHAFPRPGDYEVTLTVIDPSGFRDARKRWINIRQQFFQ
jgi:hypothetical protein